MKYSRYLQWIAVIGIGVFVGCRDCTGPSRKPLPPSSDLPEVEASTSSPLPSPGGGPIVHIKRFEQVLPVRIRAIAIVLADAVEHAVRDLAVAFSYPLALSEPDDITRRVKALYGFDFSRLGPWCAFALIEVDGPVLVCEVGTGAAQVLERPPGSVGIRVWALEGHHVPRAGVVAAAGGGFVAVGAEAAVRRVAMVHSGAWPSLAYGISRVESEIRRMGRGESDIVVSLWFLDPHAASWCLPGICEATAVFASREGIHLWAEARPGMTSVLKANIEVLWQRDVVKPFMSRALPDEVAKPADLLVQQASLETREPLISLRAGPGDPLFLAAALFPDLVMRLLGPLE